MDIHKKKKNCPYCLTLRCCLDHCCNWDNCQCGDCILCGGVLENEYTQEEKKQLQVGFKALEIIADNKPLLDKKKPKEDANLKKPTTSTNIKKEEKPAKKEEIIPKSEQKPEKKEEKPVPDTKPPAKKEETITVKDTNKETKDKIEENAKKSSDLKDLRADVKNSESEADRVRRLVDETTRKTNDTLASIERTLASLKKTQDECKATDQKFQDFQNKFQSVMDNFTSKLAEGLQNSGLIGPMHKGAGQAAEKIYQPTISDIESVAESLITKTNIAILTGAGISVASGIPTFRGKGGFWTNKNKETVKAQDFLTYQYFKENPSEVWDWHYEFKRMVRQTTPNVCHSVISELMQFCEENDIECNLITQNIDNFHVESYCKLQSYLSHQSSHSTQEESKLETITPHLFPQDSQSYGFLDNIYEIHGNINYMRCDISCSNRLFPSPEVSQASYERGKTPLPKCPLCKGLARPHTLFFDESYNEEYYKKDTAMISIENMDCLIVIGTRLETNLASRIVGEAISKDCQIIEINPEPVIECGNVLQLIGESEKIIPGLWKMTRVKFFEYHEKNNKKPKENIRI